MKWFCRLCWRTGQLFCAERDAQAQAEADHGFEVRRDVDALKIPAGMDPKFRNAPWMLKLAAKDCAGDIQIGALDKSKPRFDKKSMPTFDFQ